MIQKNTKSESESCIIGSLWFNSKKEVMKKKLEETEFNSGVGININEDLQCDDDYVYLEFDDGSSGKALIAKHSWKNCTHLIQECIGRWSRNNGLWQAKLNTRSVKVYLKALGKGQFYVYKMK